MENNQTGLNFVNALKPNAKVNMLSYMYFYNGAGMAAGDFNNDGNTDLFFCSNQGQNTLYLNEGGLHFKDVTLEAKIPNDGGWSTGVSVVDINQDGLLDLYVCRVGQYENLTQGNQLLVCKGIGENGIPFYEDQAAAFGLAFNGFSTQAAFFDQDLDGDLDMYLLNHSLRYNSTFNTRATYENTFDTLSGDRFYRNVNGKYVNETQASGIHSSVIGYGLGIAVSDINLDGYPDIYIGNDFHENDYLYINNQKGGFIDQLDSSIQHTSQFSMGVDAADINNDALPDIISMDMLPEDPYILKRSLGEDEYNLFNMKLRYGYNHQYARNNLQLNRGNGLFSEVGVYAGVHATDWSWAPLWVDFDNDGLKDLFVSNGIPRRLNDIDYVNFISNDDIQSRIRTGQMTEKEMQIIEKFPQIKLRNKFFLNKGDIVFEDQESRIKNDKETFSNGAVYADLDNDGDVDLVVNNIDASPLVYKNNAAADSGRRSINVRLKGPSGNRYAIGTKAIVYSGNEVLTFEKYPVRGFQSSMEIPLAIATGNRKIDSAHVIWPDGSWQSLRAGNMKNNMLLEWKAGLNKYNQAGGLDRSTKKSEEQFWTEMPLKKLRHIENTFNEFDREPLLPHMLSTEGPALAIGDIDQDGIEEIFLGSSKGKKSSLVSLNGKEFDQTAVYDDSTYEDVDAQFLDVNNDGWKDLVVVSAGNEYYGETPYLTPRLYLNDHGKLIRKPDAFPVFNITLSCVRSHDFNGDGFQDLFMGGRAMPFAYGKPVSSYLLLNDGTGKFKDVTSEWAPSLIDAGMVTDAQWADMNGDGKKDLVLAKEWGTVDLLLSGNNGKLGAPKAISEKGWWNMILVEDVDGDGDMDLLAGNQGMNTRLKPTAKEPIRMYYQDFDGNGIGEQVLTYYVGGKEICFAVKADLERQMPVLKKKFLYAEDFAKASLEQIFGHEKLRSAISWEATEMRSMIFINNGTKGFTAQYLPWQLQLSPIKAGVFIDMDQDGQKDLLLAGNYFENNVQLGRNDADQGSVLFNKGLGKFVYGTIPGVRLNGQIRKMAMMKDGSIMVVRNNGPVSILENNATK